jgi:hypothetical protein
MSSKSKLITAIVLLAVGAGLIPTGLVANDYLENRVYDGVPKALLGVRDDAIEGLTPELPVLSTPTVLKGIYDNAIDGLEDFILLKNTAEVLRQMKYVFVYNVYALYYAWWYMIASAASARLMNITISVVGEEAFFNDNNTLALGWLPGISTIAGYNLSYDVHARTVIQNVGMSDPYLYDVPGWLTDVDMGTGIGQLSSRGDNLNWSDPFDYTLNAINTDYLSDTAHTYAAYAYTGAMIYSYANPGFSTAYPGGVYATATNPNVGFYQQWANGTYIKNGIDINQFFAYSFITMGSPGMKGLEAGVAAPTNISLATSAALWNEADNNSFCHDDGFEYWMDAAAGDMGKAAYLMGNFSITPTQFGMLASWLYNFMNEVSPIFLENPTFGLGTTLKTIATSLFYEHWANGTIQGTPELPGGLLNELSATLAGSPYFEIGLPVESNLTLTQTMLLWNLASDKTFFFADSFQSLWLPALGGNATSVGTIMAEFGLSLAEATAVLGWLGGLIGLDPSTGRIAQIIEVERGVPLATIMLLAVYEQWANGTIEGEAVIPDGLLSRRDPPIYGPPYFELGLMYPSGLTRPQVFALWNVASDYSLVTKTGINKWYGAVEGNTRYNELKTQNGLSDIQMGGILAWLPQFRDYCVNKLGKDDLGLPLEPYALGDVLAISLGAGGGALAALGVVLLILSRRS